MLGMNDPKSKAGAIIAGYADMKTGNEQFPGHGGSAETDSSIAEESAAEELISALKAGDAKGVVAAFKSLTELCSYTEEQEPEGEG
jgi:hypothetical protein